MRGAQGSHQFTVDHIKAKSNGGYDKMKNYVGACYRCNQLKSNHDMGTFKRLLREIRQQD